MKMELPPSLDPQQAETVKRLHAEDRRKALEILLLSQKTLEQQRAQEVVRVSTGTSYFL